MARIFNMFQFYGQENEKEKVVAGYLAHKTKQMVATDIEGNPQAFFTRVTITEVPGTLTVEPSNQRVLGDRRVKALPHHVVPLLEGPAKPLQLTHK